MCVTRISPTLVKVVTYEDILYVWVFYMYVGSLASLVCNNRTRVVLLTLFTHSLPLFRVCIRADLGSDPPDIKGTSGFPIGNVFW